MPSITYRLYYIVQDTVSSEETAHVVDNLVANGTADSKSTIFRDAIWTDLTGRLGVNDRLTSHAINVRLITPW